ncbi:MAG: N-acetylmuramoyl-L-alanine amidase [Clostridia bacterium]|nr:N-acetylmuramoyl-L-alanine amidase [Clostridia bacterium]
MKMRFFAVALAVAVTFLAAVGMCIKTLNEQAVAAFSTEMRVVVDAGHGGMDGGVSGVKTGVKESDLNLALSLALYEELKDMGFFVTLTRKTEAGLYDTTAKGFKKRDMQKRKEIIEEAKPDLVLSIHQNFYPTKSARGGQVFYLKNSEEGKRLAKGIQEKLDGLYAEKGVKARKITAAEYFILGCYPCPSVIVECGFLSNPLDEELLNSSAWRKRLAQEIAGGVLAYFTGLSA